MRVLRTFFGIKFSIKETDSKVEPIEPSDDGVIKDEEEEEEEETS